MKAIADFWKRYFLPLEGATAALAVTVMAVWAHWFGGATIILDLLKGNRSPIYSALATIFGSLLGFVITAISIVITAAGSERMAIVRNSRHYETLWKVFTQAIWALAFATVASLGALVGDRDATPNWWAFYLCIAGALLSVIRVYRCIWVMQKIIHLFTANRR